MCREARRRVWRTFDCTINLGGILSMRLFFIFASIAAKASADVLAGDVATGVGSDLELGGRKCPCFLKYAACTAAETLMPHSFAGTGAGAFALFAGAGAGAGTFASFVEAGAFALFAGAGAGAGTFASFAEAGAFALFAGAGAGAGAGTFASFAEAGAFVLFAGAAFVDGETRTFWKNTVVCSCPLTWYHLFVSL